MFSYCSENLKDKIKNQYKNIDEKAFCDYEDPSDLYEACSFDSYDDDYYMEFNISDYEADDLE